MKGCFSDNFPPTKMMSHKAQRTHSIATWHIIPCVLHPTLYCKFCERIHFYCLVHLRVDFHYATRVTMDTRVSLGIEIVWQGGALGGYRWSEHEQWDCQYGVGLQGRFNMSSKAMEIYFHNLKYRYTLVVLCSNNNNNNFNNNCGLWYSAHIRHSVTLLAL